MKTVSLFSVSRWCCSASTCCAMTHRIGCP